LQNKLSNDVYLPAEDTYFLEDHIKNEKGDAALDIGSSSGYLTKSLSKSFRFVVGTDVNFEALNNQSNKPENLVCCNGADALQNKFDLIICNMPYLASEECLSRFPESISFLILKYSSESKEGTVSISRKRFGNNTKVSLDKKLFSVCLQSTKGLINLITRDPKNKF